MGEVYKEEDFYTDGGWPSESLSYCSYKFYTGNETEYGEDYDQFVLVDNALYPYIRLTEKRAMCQSPCGGMSIIATDGSFARKSEEERDRECPKIAWGFAAMFLSCLRYDIEQKDSADQRIDNGVNDQCRHFTQEKYQPLIQMKAECGVAAQVTEKTYKTKRPYIG